MSPKIENNTSKVPLGEVVIMGPFHDKNVIPSFMITSMGIKWLVPIGQHNKVEHTVTYGVEGGIRIQIYNWSRTAKLLSHKLGSVVVVTKDGKISI